MSDSFNRKVFLRFALERLKNNLFPSRCYTCLEPLLFSQHLLCADCVKSLPYIDNACIRCSESLSHSGTCPNCQKNPPYFSRCIALCNYQYPVSTALKNIKKMLMPLKQKNSVCCYCNVSSESIEHNPFQKLLFQYPLTPSKPLCAALTKVN